MAREVHKHIPLAPRTQEGFWRGAFRFDGTILQVLVEPKGIDTIYSIGIRDESGMLIFVRSDVVGPLVSESLDLVVFPGEKFIIIEDSSADELFDIKIIYQK